MLATDYPTQEQINTDIVDFKMFKARVIISGTRKYKDYKTFCEEVYNYIKTLPSPFIFYTGLATSGADKLIVRFCEEHPEYRYQGHPAEWDKHGKGAGFLRNRQMAETATHLLCFWDGKSPGTKHMIDTAAEKEIPTKIIRIPDETRRVIKVWTAQMAMWRQAKADNIKFVDATAKTGMVQFAPKMSLVMAYKAGELSQEDYTKAYIERMEISQNKAPNHWDRIKDYDEIIFACYCPTGEFCHRHILVNMVKAYLETKFDDIKVILCGEYLTRG